MAWLFDTDILSELRRLKPEPKVLTVEKPTSWYSFNLVRMTTGTGEFEADFEGQSGPGGETGHRSADKGGIAADGVCEKAGSETQGRRGLAFGSEAARPSRIGKGD